MRTALTLATLAFIAAGASAGIASETVDFRVDDDLFDANMDGFITDQELTLTGSDGAVWEFTPTNNFVGGDRFLVSEDRGLQFGGGGGSSLTFEFSVDRDVTLEAYNIAGGIFVLGNPTFQVLQEDDLLSDDNDADAVGTFGFEGGPIEIEAGLLYTVDVTTAGAAIQSFFESWNYVPSPGAATLLGMGLVIAARRRR